MSSSALIAIAVVVALFVVLKLVRKGGSEQEAAPAPKVASTPAPKAAASAATGGVSEEVMAVIAAAVAHDSNEVIAAITAALAVMGYTADQVAVIRPRRSEKWIMEARLSGRRNG